VEAAGVCRPVAEPVRIAAHGARTVAHGAWALHSPLPMGFSAARGSYLVHKTAKRVVINNFKERLVGALQLQRITLNHIRTKCFEWIQAAPAAGRAASLLPLPAPPGRELCCVAHASWCE
jgi:hypothetical protein